MANAEIIARIMGDATQLEATLQQSEAKARTFGSRIGDAFNGVGAKLAAVFSVASVATAAKAAIEYASNMTDAAEASSTGIEEYQVLSFAAREAGASQEQLSRALVRSVTAGEEAAAGNKGLSESFGRLGINLKEFNALPTELKLEALGRAFVDSGQSQRAFTDLSEILGGKVAPRLMSALVDLGTNGFGSIRDRAEEAGNVMSKTDAVSLDKLSDTFTGWGIRALVTIGEVIEAYRELGSQIANGGNATQADLEKQDSRRAALRQRAIEELKKENPLGFQTGQDETFLQKVMGGPGGQIARDAREAEDNAAIEQKITEILTEQAAKEKEIAKSKKEKFDLAAADADASKGAAESAAIAAKIAEGRAALARKELPTEERIAALKIAAAEAERMSEDISGELTGKQREAWADKVKVIETEIASIKQKAADDEAKAGERRAKLTRQLRDEEDNRAEIQANIDEAGRNRPTISNLANNDIGPIPQEAQRLALEFQKSQDLERRARAQGNDTGADLIKQSRDSIGKELEKFGVSKNETDPAARFKEALADSETKLTEIKEEIAKL